MFVMMKTIAFSVSQWMVCTFVNLVSRAVAMDNLMVLDAYVQLTIACMFVIGVTIAFSVSQWMVCTFVISVLRAMAMDSLIILRAYVQLIIGCIVIGAIIAFAAVICKYIVDAI
jgi:hypothetical protein